MSLAVAKNPTLKSTHSRERDSLRGGPTRPHVGAATFPVPFVQRKPTCPCGGGCPRCEERDLVQAKLRIGQPGDRYEQEADRVAERVMRMPEPAGSPGVSGRAPVEGIQRCEDGESCGPCADGECSREDEEEERALLQRQPMEEEEEEEEETLRAKAVAGHAPEVTPDVQAEINAVRGGGRPLPQSERAFFEPRLGYNFGGVRVHTDARAAESARAVSARSFTVGRDIVFAPGQYAPGTAAGRRLLAHELAHVVQQERQRGVHKKTLIQRYTCPPVAAPATPIPIPAPVDFDPDFTVGDPAGATIDPGMDTDDITATARRADWLNDATIFNKMSLLQVRFGYRTRVSTAGGRSRVSVNVSVTFPKVFITSEFPQGSCHSNIVRNHEMNHEPIIFLDSLEEFVQLRRDLAALPLPTTLLDVDRVAIDWCNRVRPKVERDVADRHRFHLPTIQQQFLGCPDLPMLGCNPAQSGFLTAARNTAIAWIPGTLRRLSTPSSVDAELNAHFNTRAPGPPDRILTPEDRRLAAIQRNYRELLTALKGNELRFACVHGAAGGCAGANTPGFADLGGFRVNICTRLFQPSVMSGDDRAAVLIHETHHAAVPGSLDEADEVYRHQSGYPPPAADAIRNPDSYAGFAEDVH